MSVKELIDASHSAIKEDASRAAVTFVTSGKLVGTTEVIIHARHHELTVDEPSALGGEDLGANPVEGDLDLRGFLGIDETIRPGFTAVRLTTTPRGPEPLERSTGTARSSTSSPAARPWSGSSSPPKRASDPSGWWFVFT